MAPKKQIHLNFFEVTCAGNHMGIGLWRDPNDNARCKDRFEYYLWLARLAEKGKITSIFFADTYAADESYKGTFDATYRGGSLVAQMDPVVFVSAMASVTKSVSFGITGSTSYIPPYLLARTWSTLDHASNGRIGWNVVTSFTTTAANAMGKKTDTPHDQRCSYSHGSLEFRRRNVRNMAFFRNMFGCDSLLPSQGKWLLTVKPQADVEADEYLELVYSLWEGSWEDGAPIFDSAKGAYDPEKIHKINFNGLYHKTNAVCQTHPSPQRTPILFQVGSSPSGIAFAAKHAEAVFCGGGVPSDTAPFVKNLRDATAANGRDPTDMKFFPQMTPILGRTIEEAQAKHKRYRKCIDWEAGLSKLGSFVNFDFSRIPPDEPFTFNAISSDNSIHTMLKTIKRYDTDGTLTPRMLGERMAFCGFAPMPVGTPDMVADLMETWVNEADIDGFNLAYVSNPESYEDIVELLVPVLQERGLVWQDYAVPGGTFRENMQRKAGEKLLPNTHPAAQFRYESLKKNGYTDANGHVVIDRVKAEEEPVKGANGLSDGEGN